MKVIVKIYLTTQAINRVQQKKKMGLDVHVLLDIGLPFYSYLLYLELLTAVSCA